MDGEVVAIYARKSSDPQMTRISVERQVFQCRELAGRLWPGVPLEEYVDPAVSGYDEAVVRPELERLVSDVRSGRVVQVVTSEQSRLTRRASQWDELALIFSRSGIEAVQTLKSGPVQVVEGSRLSGRLLALVDEDEAERTKIRTRMQHKQLAYEGRPHSGAKVYGYDLSVGADGRAARTINDAEAAVIREAVEAICSGRSVASIARKLTEDGVATARGGRKWWPESVRSVVSKPAVAGLRAYHGEIVGPAAWPAILDLTQWENAMASLGAPVVVDAAGKVRQAQRRRVGRPRRYLLTGGLARCGKCGTPMVAVRSTRRTGPSVAAYGCHPNGGPQACGGSTISHAERLEALVVGAVQSALDSPELRAALVSGDGDDDRAEAARALSDAEGRLRYAAQLFGAGELDRETFETLCTAAREVVSDARRRMEANGRTAAPDLLGDDLRQRWDGLTLAQQRSIIELVVEAVTVAPARPGTRGFDPDRVSITWRA